MHLISLRNAIYIALSITAPKATALTIVRNFIEPGKEFILGEDNFGTATTAPNNKAGTGTLQEVFDAAADWWEQAILDEVTVKIDFGWFGLDGSVLGDTRIKISNAPNNPIIGAVVFFDSDGFLDFNNDNKKDQNEEYSWFLDGTPHQNDEYGDLQESTKEFTTNSGKEEINVGRIFTAPEKINNKDNDAFGRYDLLTVAKHEIGHALGFVNEHPKFSDPVTVEAPLPFAGAKIPTTDDHIKNFTDSLMTDRQLKTGERQLQSEIDILAVAQVGGFKTVDLSPHCPKTSQGEQNSLDIQAEQSSLITLGCFDFGDAPDTYKTRLPDGPRYQEGELQRLGFGWDSEFNGQPTPRADGDDEGPCACTGLEDVDDEDGVIFGDTFVDVIFNITRPGANDYQLRAWWDVNENDMFDHPTELFIDDLLTLDPGSNMPPVGVTLLEPGLFKKRYNLGFDPRDFYSRFRLTYDPLDLDVKPFGEFVSADGISHGEVEDYAPVPEPTSTLGLLALGTIGASSALLRNNKQKKS